MPTSPTSFRTSAAGRTAEMSPGRERSLFRSPAMVCRTPHHAGVKAPRPLHVAAGNLADVVMDDDLLLGVVADRIAVLDHGAGGEDIVRNLLDEIGQLPRAARTTAPPRSPSTRIATGRSCAGLRARRRRERARTGTTTGAATARAWQRQRRSRISGAAPRSRRRRPVDRGPVIRVEHLPHDSGQEKRRFDGASLRCLCSQTPHANGVSPRQGRPTTEGPPPPPPPCRRERAWGGTPRRRARRPASSASRTHRS